MGDDSQRGRRGSERPDRHSDTLELAGGAVPMLSSSRPFGHRHVGALAEGANDTLVDGPREPDQAAQLALERLGGLVGKKYRLVRVIGAGSAGAVFEAHRVADGERLAVKLLHRGQRSRDQEHRFHREARLAQKIRHPNVLQVYDAGMDEDGSLYQVSELLQGRPLGTAMEERLLTVEETVEVGRQLLAALDVVHSHGYVHRDVKPENVFLSQIPGGGMCVKLLDFGIVKPLQSTHTSPFVTLDGVILGTPSYMSPEQITGQYPVSPASDLWAVGALMFDALTGHAPFEDSGLGRLLVKITHEQAPLVTVYRPEAPETLVHVIERALRKDPAERWRSAREMASALSVGGAAIDDLDWDD